MKISFTFRHIDASEALKNAAAEKLAKSEALLSDAAEVHVIFEDEGKLRKVEITLKDGLLKGSAQDESDDMYKSLNAAVHKIEAQIRKHKSRLVRHR